MASIGLGYAKIEFPFSKRMTNVFTFLSSDLCLTEEKEGKKDADKALYPFLGVLNFYFHSPKSFNFSYFDPFSIQN